MFLSITTTHQPATDLGFLLMKHPGRVHEAELPFGGKAQLFFPESEEARAEAVMILDLDPVALVRGKGGAEGIESAYVNDRPYAVSSFLSVAINKLLKSALSGTSRERQALADTEIPMVLRFGPVPATEEALLGQLFEPLGWQVHTTRIAAGDDDAVCLDVSLSGAKRVAEALSHLYVLIPVLDDAKHYWVGDDEVDKLVARGGEWLASHPARALITKRYLKYSRDLAQRALARISEGAGARAADDGPFAPPALRREDAIEAPMRLADHRVAAICEVLMSHGATRVTDLGCGEGRLLSALSRDRRFTRLIGVDVSPSTLDCAARRLELATAPAAQRARVSLLQGSLTYFDTRWCDVDAAVLSEVIEHVDLERLPTLEACVFGTGVKLIVVTTPNAEFNVRFPGLPSGQFRHPDHRFEWDRATFEAWASRVAACYAYEFSRSDIGETDPALGAPTQMAVFAARGKP